jgi:hypothetical protein
VTLFRAARLIQQRPIARNLCAGFWGPQRTPAKAELRASFLSDHCYKIKVYGVLPDVAYVVLVQIAIRVLTSPLLIPDPDGLRSSLAGIEVCASYE